MIPTDYQSWRTCITKLCKIPLEKDYIQQRITALEDKNSQETKKFVRLYGEEHRERVLGWFRKAQKEA